MGGQCAHTDEDLGWRKEPADDRRRASLAEAADGFLRWTLPAGRRPPSQRTVERLVVAPSAALAGLDHAERRETGAAMLVAKARHGSIDEAVALAEVEVSRTLVLRDDELPAATLATFWGAVSEVYATAGLARHATPPARRAHAFAKDAGNDQLLYRGYGLLAANLALNGEFVAAEEAIAKAVEMESAHHWQLTPAAYLLLVGQILLASARMDAENLTLIAARLRQTLPDDPSWRALATLAEAVVALWGHRPDDGIAAITAVTNSADEGSIPQLILDFLISYHATLLIARGEPRTALALLDGRESPGDHTVCFGLQRASAYLNLGEDRNVLTTTGDCFRRGVKHCLRTLPPVLLRRAIANERLGHRGLADLAFADAFHLLHKSGAATPLLTLPRNEVEVLLARFADNRPDLAGAVEQLRQRSLSVPEVERPALLAPLLSEREALIAQHLRTPATLAEIAAALFVSRNTVKSQTASLYRKLGTSNREDAVALLERSGFYAYPR